MKPKHLRNTLLLFFLWAGLTSWSILQYDKSIFVVTEAHSFDSFTQVPDGKVTAGQVVSGEFFSNENNLGSVSIHFDVGRRVAYQLEDRLIFRIKEKGAEKWYYENIYRSGMMYDAPFFPFGFQPISDSKGRTYEFEIVSIKGDERNAHSIKKSLPTLESKYLVDRGKATDSAASFAGFLVKKVINKITTLELVFFSLVVSLPLISYLVWITFLYKTFNSFINEHPGAKKIMEPMFEQYGKFHKMMEESYFLILGVCLFAAVVIDIFFIQVRADLIYLVVLFMWIRSLKNNLLSDGISITLTIGFLLLAAILDVMSLTDSAVKAGAWSLIFFISSLIFIIKRGKYSAFKQ